MISSARDGARARGPTGQRDLLGSCNPVATGRNGCPPTCRTTEVEGTRPAAVRGGWVMADQVGTDASREQPGRNRNCDTPHYRTERGGTVCSLLGTPHPDGVIPQPPRHVEQVSGWECGLGTAQCPNAWPHNPLECESGPTDHPLDCFWWFRVYPQSHTRLPWSKQDTTMQCSGQVWCSIWKRKCDYIGTTQCLVVENWLGRSIETQLRLH